MEKKGTIVSLIFVAVLVLCAVGFIIFTGITAREYNYVQLEINPKIEFICDNNFKVVSCRPLNNDAKIVLANVNYQGMTVEDASVDFLDICAQTGYIDVNGSNNAVNVTVIDGLTQALDVHIIKKINSYLRKNEILCAVTETYEDRSMIDSKKENNICCTNKLKLIYTIMDYDKNANFDTLKNMSEVELIDMVANIHNTSVFHISDEQKNIKEKLIEQNKEIYEKHKKAITTDSQKEFSKIFDNYSKTSAEKYKLNYNKEYNNWQNNILY